MSIRDLTARPEIQTAEHSAKSTDDGGSAPTKASFLWTHPHRVFLLVCLSRLIYLNRRVRQQQMKCWLFHPAIRLPGTELDTRCTHLPQFLIHKEPLTFVLSDHCLKAELQARPQISENAASSRPHASFNLGTTTVRCIFCTSSFLIH